MGGAIPYITAHIMFLKFLNAFVLALKHYTEVPKLKGCLLLNNINSVFSGYPAIFCHYFCLKFNFFIGWNFTFPKINIMKEILIMSNKFNNEYKFNINNTNKWIINLKINFQENILEHVYKF